MNNLYDIILHGKPNAHCYRYTDGIDETFCKNIAERFFQSMNTIKEKQTLIVDVRKWKGTMYTVYTFWRGDTVSDVASRTSYLAISLVVPGYLHLVSSVYDLLENVCREYVVGHYVSENWTYLVSDFGDKDVFDKFVASITESFENIHDYFDGNFSIPSEVTQTHCCNILDCDSRFFREELKQHGRIYVSKTFPSKNDSLEQMQKQLRRLETSCDANRSTDDALRPNKQQNHNLTKELQGLQETNNKLAEELQKYRNKKRQEAGLPEEDAAHSKTRMHVNITRRTAKFKGILLLINTLLLILLCMKSYDTGHDAGQRYYNENLDSIKTLINYFVADMQNWHSHDSTNTNSDADKDDDCELQIMRGAVPVKNVMIKVNDEITIIPKHHNNFNDKYEFYVSNLKPEQEILLHRRKAFKLIKENNTKPIDIHYRRENQQTANEKNKLTIR